MRFNSIKNYILTEFFHIRIKPQTIQLPITSKCNSRCATCNIWKCTRREDINVEKLKKALSDKYFSNVHNVGINGGEPFLHKNFIGVIKAVLTLKRIKSLYIISNGLSTDKIIENLEKAKQICDNKGVHIYLTISVDGVDDYYSKVRGVPGGYNRVINTLSIISKNLNRYCSSLTIGTTISKWNIENVASIKAVSSRLDIPVNYHIAVPNRRIHTNDNYDYSVLKDQKSLFLAREFFYGLFKYSPSVKQKLLYFQNYYYLLSNGTKRISGCSYKSQDITIDENLNLFFCAKESKSIGNVGKNSAMSLIKTQKARRECKRIMKCCSSCGHYITMPSIKGLLLFIRELIKPSVWLRYKLYARIRRYL